MRGHPIKDGRFLKAGSPHFHHRLIIINMITVKTGDLSAHGEDKVNILLSGTTGLLNKAECRQLIFSEKILGNCSEVKACERYWKNCALDCNEGKENLSAGEVNSS